MRYSLIFIVFISASCLLSATCGKKTTTPDTVPPVQPAATSPIELVGYSVHLVRPGKPFKRLNDKGEKQEFAEAWLVRMEIKNAPLYTGPALDFFIGDYKIPEYGGWADGIYFRIYEKEVLEKLNGQSISCQMEGAAMQRFEQKFQLPDLSKLVPEEEAKILKRG